jgi:hypothetical protein
MWLSLCKADAYIYTMKEKIMVINIKIAKLLVPSTPEGVAAVFLVGAGDDADAVTVEFLMRSH